MKPEKSRILSLVFVVEDAPLVLDDKGLPLLRPSSGEIPPLVIAVARKLIDTAKSEAQEEKKRIGLSKFLFNDVFGVEAEGQIVSLQKLAMLSSSVYTKIQDENRKAVELFQAATDSS